MNFLDELEAKAKAATPGPNPEAVLKLIAAYRELEAAVEQYTWQDNTYDNDIMTDGAVAIRALSRARKILCLSKEEK